MGIFDSISKIKDVDISKIKDVASSAISLASKFTSKEGDNDKSSEPNAQDTKPKPQSAAQVPVVEPKPQSVAQVSVAEPKPQPAAQTPQPKPKPQAEPQLPQQAPQNGKIVINTLDGMSSWLRELQTYQTTPSAMQALQSQIQVLNYVKSPNLTSMAVDTIIMCLYKALKSAASETEKDAVRESFALMIQSFMFFNEAELQYAINSNKEEGVLLLSQAGEVLTKSVVSVAATVVAGICSGGGAVVAKVGSVVVENVFANQNGQKSFYAKIVSFIGDKKRIEERKAQHIEMLNNTFTMFDRYAKVIGPSIVLHGMLGRYGKQLIENFEEQKTKYIVDNLFSKLDVDGLKEDTLKEDIIKTTVAILNPLSLLNTFATDTLMGDEKEKTVIDHDYILLLRNKSKERLNDCERTLNNEKEELARMQKMYDDMPATKIKVKNELKGEIGNLEISIHNSEEKVNVAKKELAQAELAVEKMNELKPEIEAYAVKIKATVEKFAFDYSDDVEEDNSMYHISVNGQTMGPYSVEQLQDMAEQGSISRETFVWTKGMAGWEKAGSVEKLSEVFDFVPPPPPPMM